MDSSRSPFLRASALALALIALVPSARAAFHVMQIEEIIGSINGNTSAQAIQLRLRSSGQSFVSNAKLWAWDATGSNRVLVLDIASNVSNSAGGARILLATSGFTSTMIAGGATNFSPDFLLASNIPSSYLTAGRLTFEDDGGSTATPGTIYWSASWGGVGYTGAQNGSTQNDADGNFGPAFGGALKGGSTLAPGMLFNGISSAQSTNNAADYVATSFNATVTRNNGTSFTVVPEPGSVALLALGGLALGGFAFGRRRAARGRV